MVLHKTSKGIILTIIAMTMFAMQDSLIKFIFEKSSLYEIFFSRYVVAAILLFGYLKIRTIKVNLKTNYPYLTIFRVLFHFIAFSAFFVSLTYMPLATANALFFSCPFFVSMFATLFLKEFVGIRRWSAIAFGFTGVLIVLNPNFSDFDYKSLLPVVSAFFYAASMTITKYTSDKDNIYTQMTWLYIFALFASLVIFFVSGDGKFNTFTDPTLQFIVREWFTNPGEAWPYVLIMGIVASISFFCVFTAYSIASPSVVSLFEYSYIVFAMVAGYILFETIPVPRTFLGASIIIGAGVYIYFREKVRGQMIATDTPANR